jgi:chemotaxis protein MotB
METEGGVVFFERSSAELKPAMTAVLQKVASALGELPNDVVVEGHTDSLPFRGRSGYSNWELSVDRANAARRILIAAGLPGERVAEVRGYAARELKNRDNPLDPRNRRISLLIPFTNNRVQFTAADLEQMLVDGRPVLPGSAGPGAGGPDVSASSNRPLAGGGE